MPPEHTCLHEDLFMGLREDMKEIKDTIKNGNSELRVEIAAVRSEVKSDVAALRADVQSLREFVIGGTASGSDISKTVNMRLTKIEEQEKSAMRWRAFVSNVVIGVLASLFSSLMTWFVIVEVRDHAKFDAPIPITAPASPSPAPVVHLVPDHTH